METISLVLLRTTRFTLHEPSTHASSLGFPSRPDSDTKIDELNDKHIGHILWAGKGEIQASGIVSKSSRLSSPFAAIMHYPTMKTKRPLLGETLGTTNPCAALISEKIGREPGALVFNLYPVRCQRPKYTKGTDPDEFYRPYLKQYGPEVEKACHEMALATLEESEAKVVIMCGQVVHDFIVANVRKLVPISVSETHMFDEFDHIRAQLDDKGNICRLYSTTYHPGKDPGAQTGSECAIRLIRSREFHAPWQQSRSGNSERHALQLRMRVGRPECFCFKSSHSHAKGIKTRVESGTMWKKYFARYGLRETVWEMVSRDKNTNASSDVFKKESFPAELVSLRTIAVTRVI
jgi:hypothetical protein